MKWSLTLPGLPRARRHSKSQHLCKEEVKIMKGFPRTWVLTGKQFQALIKRKNRNMILDLSKKPTGTQGP